MKLDRQHVATLGLAAGLALGALTAGCSSAPAPQSPPVQSGGGYYQNDGPPDDTRVDLSQYPDAVPQNAPLSKYGNPASYTALGQRYYVLKSAAGFTQTGRASWYGRQFHGERTSSGEPYNMFAMTAAHKRLPIPTWVQVTNLENYRQIVVKVNDRGPFHDGRIIDLSYIAARRLGIVGEGSAPVRIHTVTPDTNEQTDSADTAPRTPRTPTPLKTTAPSSSASPTGQARGAASSHPPASSKPIAVRQQSRADRLQIGAFSSADRAKRVQRRVVRLGISSVGVIAPSSDVRLYRVRVGPFETDAQRHRIKQQLADAGFPVREVKR